MIISAGNDIVDLQAIDTARTNNPRFYTKFITGPETRLYSRPQLACMPFEHFVWLLWSVKESVYKFEQRHNPGLVFSPSKISVQYINSPSGSTSARLPEEPIEVKGFDKQIYYSGAIVFEQQELYFCSVINNAYIASFVNNINSFENIYWGIKRIDHTGTDFQSVQVREFILKRLKHVTPAATPNIIKNDSGCPVLYNGAAETNHPISLAHHGHYVAYAFHLANAPDADRHSIS